MPTGLTWKIYNGSDTSLRGFVLQCLTQMSAGYRATEGGSKALPRDKAPVLKVGDYHNELLHQAKERLQYWLKMKDNPDLCKKEYEEERRLEAEWKDNSDLKARYTDMLQKVESWNVDSKYNSLKELMRNQLKECIKADCIEYALEQEIPVEEWVRRRIKDAQRQVNYHEEELEKEKRCVEESNKYLKGLYEAIDLFEAKNNEK